MHSGRVGARTARRIVTHARTHAIVLTRRRHHRFYIMHILKAICRCCIRPYTDSSFPPTAKTLGPIRGENEAAVASKTVWLKGDEIAGGEMRLFSGKIEPADIGQGQLGDCWLLSAFACLAEFPGAIVRVFNTKYRSVRGK